MPGTEKAVYPISAGQTVLCGCLTFGTLRNAIWLKEDGYAAERKIDSGVFSLRGAEERNAERRLHSFYVAETNSNAFNEVC
jgi:hypothetical protein